MANMATKVNDEIEGPRYSHFSHEHPLELASLGEPAATATITCSGCSIQILAGRDYYTCRPCSFSLHSACFKMPPYLLHQADPDHHLTLLHNLPASSATACCRACTLPLGPGFSYHCSTCRVHYHSLCVFRPISKTIASHPHQLSLQFSSPYGAGEGFRCDGCRNPGSHDEWLYRCDPCGFDSHVDCSSATASLARTSATPITTSRSVLSKPPGSGPLPPAGYPPIGHGVGGTAGAATIPQQQQPAGMAMGPGPIGQTYQQLPVPGYPGSANVGYPGPYASGPAMVGAGGQAVLGGGIGGLVMTSALTGMGEGMGQGLVQTAWNGLGNDGSGWSGRND